jgi:glycosyltransferase involved in cell wall biosynthesis
MSYSGKSPRILYIQYNNPGAYPPLLHSSQILAREGWQVLFLGIGMNSMTIPEHPNVQVKLRGFCPPGWKQKLHYLWFSAWCFFWACRWRPDWIYASDLGSPFPAMFARVALGCQLVFHEHDTPAPYNPAHDSAFLRLFYWARRKCACLADLCILPNENRAKLFRSQTGAARVAVVWNCPSVEEVTAPKKTPDPVLRLLYHGSIVPERLPLTVVQALKQVSRPVLLTIVGYETIGAPGYVAQIRQTAKELGIPDRLEIIGALPREDLMPVCATCDVGLALLPIHHPDVNLENMTGASNKPFDYLACGLAVLVSRLPAWQNLYVSTGYGFACNPTDPLDIAAAIEYCCDHRKEIQAMGERGRQRILSEWNYEAQFQNIVKLLSEGQSPAITSEQPAA